MGTSPYSTIYSFGDSLSDAGDAYLLTSSSLAGDLQLPAEPVHQPYFQETYGTVTANVFSNGPVWVQDLATSLGLATPAPGEVGITASSLTSILNSLGIGGFAASAIVTGLELAQNATGPNPYLQLAAGAGGTDFAIGGSVTGVTAENAGATVPLTDLAAQLGNFQAQVPHPDANALYTVWSGSNDLLNLLQDGNFAALMASGVAAADVTASVANEIAMLHSLVSDGAQALLVVNVPDLGKVPQITQLASPTLDAIATSLAASFDQQLATALTAGNFGTASVKLEDTAAVIDAAVANPAIDGLTNATAPVYTGSFTQDNGTLVSPDPAVQNTYLFFDALHPTAQGQSVIAANALTALGIACFAAGTQIDTPSGGVAVEALRPGERVLVRRGTAAVRWVGRRTMALTGRRDAQPVRIAAGAFGAGQPARDLLLSPEHAVFVDGALVPIRALLGCAGIATDWRLENVTYYHVELHRHDVLRAEGLLCESWRDTGNRAMFANADAAAARRRMTPCAPIVESGPLLDAIRSRLGGTATQELTLDRVGVFEMVIAPGTGAVRLASRVGGAPGDARRLGAAVTALALDGAALGLADARLVSGFHAAEAAWRWTDGAALLTVGAARALRVEVAAVAIP